MPPAPPYALETPLFRFRARAALAGRAPLGGDREVALAALLVGRLAAGALPPHALPQGAREARATGARAWLAALALPATVRSALSRLVDASAAIDRDGIAPAVLGVLEATAPHLDGAALAELTDLIRSCEGTE